jgi:hypothetical protein
VPYFAKKMLRCSSRNLPLTQFGREEVQSSGSGKVRVESEHDQRDRSDILNGCPRFCLSFCSRVQWMAEKLAPTIFKRPQVVFPEAGFASEVRILAETRGNRPDAAGEVKRIKI